MEDIMAILLSFMFYLLRCIVTPFFALIHFRRLPGIPPINNPLLNTSATILASKIRRRQLSSQTIVEAYIERIQEVNPFLNAIIEERFEEAVNEAKACDRTLRTGRFTTSYLENRKPLFGVPITVKESLSVEGMSLTGACLKRKGFKATRDGKAVKQLKEAGAIILLVSNTSELCMVFNSFNYIAGQTVNPYDRRKTSGGSSGGEAALIASGASVIGIGSDLSGSIRLPSSFCGIFGHKPTSGLVPINGHFPSMIDKNFRSYLSIGPLTRYAEDLELMMKALTINVDRPLYFGKALDVKKLRVYYVDNIDNFYGVKSTLPEIRETIHRAVDYFSNNGAWVEEIQSVDWTNRTCSIIAAAIADIDIPEILIDPHMNPNIKRPYVEFLKAIFGLSDYTATATFVRLLAENRGIIRKSKRQMYKKLREEIKQNMNDTLKDDGIFIHPIVPRPASYPEIMVFRIDILEYSTFTNVIHLPSTNIPMGLNKDGLPIGFQVTAGSYQDHLCLAVAKELEQAFGGWIPPS